MTKDAAKRRLNEIQHEVTKLQAEAAELRKLIQSLTREEDTQAFLADIHNLEKGNTMATRLSHDTKTTPLMEKFWHSDKTFLLFEQVCSVTTNLARRWCPVSLVVKRGAPGLEIIDSGLTMTDFKKYAGAVFTSNFFSKSSRLYSLVEELLQASKKISESTKTVAFEHPIRLGGQTFKDQTGFGSEYHGDSLVVPGKLYGETTGFLIIGLVVDFDNHGLA